jgi:hypothetical protein
MSVAVPLWTRSDGLSKAMVDSRQQPTGDSRPLMWRTRFSLAVLSLLAGALVLASPASSAPPTFKVKASRGYQLHISSFNNQTVLVTAIRRFGSGGLSYTTYSTRGSVTPTMVRAKFGRFGQIDVRFRDAGRGGHSTQCNHEYTFGSRLGIYAGKVVFKGEGGFTEARASGGKVAFPPADPFDCALQKGSNEVTATLLSAATKRNAKAFYAVKLKPTGEAVFGAGQTVRKGRIRIDRFMEAVAQPSAFTYPADLSTASIGGLPAPFSGSASFDRASRAWTGDLAVQFPGAQRVQLAGSPFAVSLKPLF